jgi:hypothetical protein
MKSLPARLMDKALWHLIPFRFHPGMYITGLAESRTHATVQTGPFRGMRYIDRSHSSGLIPKWLGTYERELRDCIEEAITTPFRTVLDIGAAEGYYAVGLALRMRDAKIIAFEMDPSARELLKKMVDLNGVGSRVAIEAECTTRILAAALKTSGMTLIVCDIEGGEAMLLDPIRVPELAACSILVELHDHVIGGLSQELRDRFTATHTITHIWQEERARSEFPYRTLYTKMIPSSVDLGLSEWRSYKMAWYWMRPHASGARPGMPA